MDFYATRRWRWLSRATRCFYLWRCRKCGGPGEPGNPLQACHLYARARGPKGRRLQWAPWNLYLMHKSENMEQGTGFEDLRYAWVQRWFPIEDRPY